MTMQEFKLGLEVWEQSPNSIRVGKIRGGAILSNGEQKAVVEMMGGCFFISDIRNLRTVKSLHEDY